MSFNYKTRGFTTAAMVAALVLCGLGLFGCAYQALEEEKPSKYDEAGRLLVDFSVPTEFYGGGVRALSVEVAQSAWDYVQVVFEFDVENDGFGNGDNRFYAGSAARGEELHFSLPEGDYRALMFLGTKSGLRLLATGAVTGVKDADKYLQEDILDGLFKITREVRTIEFTVSSLVSDIEEGALTFSSPVYKNGFDNITTVLDGGMVPYFNIPSAVQLPYTEEGAIKGTFAFSGFPDTLTPGGDAVELGAVTPAKDAWLDLVNDKTTMIQTIGVLAYNRKTESELAPVPVTGTVQYVRLLYGKLRIDFGLKTSESPELKIGFNKLQFFASVQAFKNGDGLGDKGDVWRIANGFRAEELDLGGSSMGQNILLMVGKPEEMTDLVDIVITSVDADAAEPFYVSNIGNDDANGSKMNPFRTLLTAYEAASADDKRKTIAVMTDLEKDDAVELAITNDLTITIRGVDVNNPPALTRTTGTDDSVINISGGAKVKFQNITIDGKVGGANRALHVSGEGTKVTLVRGATITGEAESSGGGVLVDAGAWFVLNGGEIVDSVSGEIGGGVYVSGSFLTSTLFTMYSGKISRNTASGSIGGAGGGVFIRNATFMMSGGEISGNEVSGADDSAGGGVYITGGFTTFEMTGGVISGNTSSGGGGGVSGGNLAKFNMYDGVIYGPNATPEELANTAAFNGGATYFPDSASGNMNITLDATIRFDSSGAIVVE
jgi:hypothetical protein